MWLPSWLQTTAAVEKVVTHSTLGVHQYLNVTVNNDATTDGGKKVLPCFWALLSSIGRARKESRKRLSSEMCFAKTQSVWLSRMAKPFKSKSADARHESWPFKASSQMFSTRTGQHFVMTRWLSIRRRLLVSNDVIRVT